MTRRQEKEALRTAYRQFVNRFDARKKKTGSEGKKQVGQRGTATLVMDYRGRKQWRRERVTY